MLIILFFFVTLPLENGCKIYTKKMIQHNYTGQQAANIAVIIDEMNRQGITNEFAQVGILSVIGKESGFIPQCEKSYRNTSNERLRKLFGKRLKRFSEDELTALKKNDELFFDYIYGMHSGIKWNTGNTAPGEGFAYRGRGFNQITFKNLYKKYSPIAGVDLVAHPEKLNEIEIAAKLAVYFLIHGVNLTAINDVGEKNFTLIFCKLNAGTVKDMTDTLTYKQAKQIEKNFKII